MEKKTLVLYTIAEVGHLFPMVELGKLFLQNNLNVSVVVVSLHDINSDRIDSYISQASATHSISIHRLQLTSPPTNIAAGSFHLLRLANPQLLDYLRSASSVTALILDLFCGAALEVAVELSLPVYYFVPNAAFSLIAFLYLPTLHAKSTASLKDLGDSPIHFPGLSRPLLASDLPGPVSDWEDETCKAVIPLFERVPTAKGLIINTFESLEAGTLRALAEGVSVPGGTMSPIYPVGPVTAEKIVNEARHESLAWLDGQPSGSVVFLSFGSLGVFPKAQLRQIAEGLDRSGQRFLWVVRAPPPEEHKGQLVAWGEADLEELLPEGFVDRLAGRGLIVKSWAPQVEVLEHEAVGGFVTHCGWNSVLESIFAGVAMIAWPMYAEQRMNKVFLVEAGLAVEMRGHKEGMVGSGEVEEKVRWLMEEEGGRVLKERLAAVREEARAAQTEGGTAHAALKEIVRILS
ncbi:hypothetical protein HPP92_016263 [Vanilla planifolia]|uniref:Uncharacterized protein n=1 Tax=Vanilla planifolia TaxID=51239 RepID=A0A835QIZ5_VANPL|nr:hypothetical protein HPP92_016263 [Vanilla planifolia]